jgi:hypothetical protein
VSDFFDSPVVRSSIEEINNLQEELVRGMMRNPFDQPASDDEKMEQLRVMRTILEKQKNFMFRLKLSDDPQALEMKNAILDSAKLLGMKDDQDIEEFFGDLENTLMDLENSLDN